MIEPVILKATNRLTKQRRHDVATLGALKLQRGDVGLTNLDIETGVGGHALRPHQHITVGQRQPKTVLLKSQQHRVIQNAPGRVGNQHILALAHRALRKITWRE